MSVSLGVLTLLSLTLGTILAWSLVDLLPWWTSYGLWMLAPQAFSALLLGSFVALVFIGLGTGDTSRAGGILLAAFGAASLAALVGGWGWYVLRPTVLGTASPLPGLGRHPLVYPAVVAIFGLLQLGIGYLTILTGEETYAASKESYPDLDASMTRLAQAADVAKPRISIVESSVPNSMAIRLGNRSTVVVSTGLLDALSEDELDAVLAHELAHLKNRDATVMTLAQSVSAFAGRLITASAAFQRQTVEGPPDSKASQRASHRSSNEWKTNRDDESIPVFSVVLGLILRVVTTLLVWPFWVVGLFAYATLSRYRELAADRAAVAITGKPDALASALRTIDGGGPPGLDLRLTEDAAKPACIVPHGFSESANGSESVAFRTHPTLETRLAKLEQLSAEVESQ